MSSFVAPKGSDSGDGGQAAPFESIERARDAIREMAPEERRQDILVIPRAGLFTADETILRKTPPRAVSRLDTRRIPAHGPTDPTKKGSEIPYSPGVFGASQGRPRMNSR